MQPSPNTPWHIYVAESESGLVKIGRTINPKRRTTRLKNGSGFRIKQQHVSSVCYNYLEIERTLKAQFLTYRTEGEWFAVGFQTVVDALNQMTLQTEPTSTQMVSFFFEKREVRTFVDAEGNLCFIAKDVCEVLEVQNISQACGALDDDEKGICKIYTLGGEQEMLYVTESGLYTLIIRSNKPHAKPFRRWVTHEVIPTIRKTGKYELPAKIKIKHPERLNLEAFIAECAVKDPDGVISTEEIYAAYRDWSNRYQRPVYSHQLLGRHLRECGYAPAKRQQGKRCWSGLRLNLPISFNQKLEDLQTYLSALRRAVEAKKDFPQAELLILIKVACAKARELS